MRSNLFQAPRLRASTGSQKPHFVPSLTFTHWIRSPVSVSAGTRIYRVVRKRSFTQTTHQVHTYVYISINATELCVYEVGGVTGKAERWTGVSCTGLQMQWHFLRSFQNRDDRRIRSSTFQISDWRTLLCTCHRQTALEFMPCGTKGPFKMFFFNLWLFWCAWENNECLFITLLDSFSCQY